MALKKRNKVDAAFNMSSMTDMIFLLLLFFMIAATMSAPNDIKVNLPQSRATKATKSSIVRVGISSDGVFSVAHQKEKAQEVAFEDLEALLVNEHLQDSTVTIALHADEEVPYREVVKILDIANANRIKLVVATKALGRKNE